MLHRPCSSAHLAVLLACCASPSDLRTPEDAGISDARVDPDASSSIPDAGDDVDANANAPDHLVLSSGFGVIMGDCDAIDDAEWTATAPFLFTNTVDFGGTTYDPNLLSPAGQEVISDGNAGGSSIESEAVAADLLERCEQASLLKTENEVQYIDAGSKKADLLVEIDGHKVGVSVTRAYHFPEGPAYTEAEALPLITRKLNDIVSARSSAAPADTWDRSMLYVLAYSPEAADAMAQAWNNLDAAVKGDHLVIVSRTDGLDSFLY